MYRPYSFSGEGMSELLITGYWIAAFFMNK
jgi:hypothetical protein